jgi:hypothetical protein
MLRPSHAQLARAGRLLAAEGAGAGDAGGHAAGRVFDKVHAELDPVLGHAGVEALFRRSAKLAQDDLGTLSTALSFDSSTRLREGLLDLEPAESLTAMTVLFGTLFALIETFIGERLMLELLRRAWPALDDTEPGET